MPEWIFAREGMLIDTNVHSRALSQTSVVVQYSLNSQKQTTH